MYQSQPPRKNNASPQHVPIQREEVIRSPQTESFSPDKEMFASGTGTAQLMALQKVLGNRGTMQRVRAEQQANALIQRAAEEEAGDMDELEAMMQPQEMEGAAEAPSGAIPVQRMEAEDAPEADELEALLQAQEVDEGTTSDDMPVQRAVEAAPSSVELPSSAAALNQTGMPDALKSGIESMSGMDMSDVRVHYNSREPDKVNAHAYAQGSDIHLAPGQDQHLPHEAWHVVQQRQGRVQPTMQLESGVSINDDAGLEQEATDMGARALSEGVTQRQVASEGVGYYKKSEPIQAKINVSNTTMQLVRWRRFTNFASSMAKLRRTNNFVGLNNPLLLNFYSNPIFAKNYLQHNFLTGQQAFFSTFRTSSNDQNQEENNNNNNGVTVEYKGKRVNVYRGGNSFKVKLNEVKIDKVTGFVKKTHGVSLDVKPDTVSRFGGAYRLISLPDELKIIQRGSKLEHYEIVPNKDDMTLEEFQEALNNIRLSEVIQMI